MDYFDTHFAFIRESEQEGYIDETGTCNSDVDDEPFTWGPNVEGSQSQKNTNSFAGDTAEHSKKEVFKMSTEIVKYDEKFSEDQINVIKSQIAKGATDNELKMFVAIAQKYDLDPFLKELWFIKQAKKQSTNRKGPDGKYIWDYPRNNDGTIDYSGAETLIYTSRDGYLKIAQRDQHWKGIISFAVCENDTFEIDAENYRVIHKFGAKRGKIIGAWAKVDHKINRPVITYVPFNEYYSEKSTVWKQYPTAMIVKVAEVFALKRQFGISGLVTREEMSCQIEEVEQIQELPPVNNVPQIEQPTEPIISRGEQKSLFGLTADKELIRKVVLGFGYESTKDITRADYMDICNKIIELSKSQEPEQNEETPPPAA